MEDLGKNTILLANRLREVFNILDCKDKLSQNKKRLDHKSVITQTASVMGQKELWNFEQRQQNLFDKNKTLKHLNEIIPWGTSINRGGL